MRHLMLDHNYGVIYSTTNYELCLSWFASFKRPEELLKISQRNGSITKLKLLEKLVKFQNFLNLCFNDWRSSLPKKSLMLSDLVIMWNFSKISRNMHLLQCILHNV